MKVTESKALVKDGRAKQVFRRKYGQAIWLHKNKLIYTFDSEFSWAIRYMPYISITDKPVN